MVHAVTSSASFGHWNSRRDRRDWSLPANHIEEPAPETRRSEPTAVVDQCRLVRGPVRARSARAYRMTPARTHRSEPS